MGKLNGRGWTRRRENLGLNPSRGELPLTLWASHNNPNSINKSLTMKRSTDTRCIRMLVTEIFARKHMVAVRKRSWVQDGLWSNQSCPLPTLTRRLEPNDRSRFVILA